MEDYKDVHVDDMNIGSETESIEKKPVRSEESDNVVCSQNIAAAAVDHTEDDEENFEDAFDNLTLDSSVIAEDYVGSSYYDECAQLDINTLQPSQSNVQSDQVLLADTESAVASSRLNEAASDSRNSSVREDDEEAASDTVIVDDEVLRQQEACLTDEQKQVIHYF